MSTSLSFATGSARTASQLTLRRHRKRRIAALPVGAVPVALGLGVMGLTSYGYLAIAARALSPAEFTRLGIVWTLLFTLGPGLFLPLEQDLARRIAGAAGRRARQLLARTAAVGAALVLVLALLALAGGRAISDRLLGGDEALLPATVAASAVLALAYGSRGVLAGHGSFHRYGLQLGADGVLRLVGAIVLALLAQRSAVPFAWLLALAPLCAVAISLARTRKASSAPAERIAQPATADAPLLRGLAWLLVGTLAAQIMINGGVIAVKLLAVPGDNDAGRFLTALLMARVPLLLFAALQVSLLPGLSRLAVVGDTAGLRAALRRCVLAVVALSSVSLVVLAAFGGPLSSLLFGSPYRVGTVPLTVLCAGTAAFMVCTTYAQALLATHHTSAVALAWLVGIAGFVAALLLPGAVVTRVSVAMLVGALLSLMVCGLALRRWVPRPIQVGGCPGW